MTKEQHTTNRELSMRLKELGVPQASLFVWSVTDHDSMTPEVAFASYASSVHGKGTDCSAFLVSELGLLLPQEVEGYSWRTLKTPRKGAWEIKYRKREPGRFHPVILHQLSDPREADARARMLIWLIEAGLIGFGTWESRHVAKPT